MSADTLTFTTEGFDYNEIRTNAWDTALKFFGHPPDPEQNIRMDIATREGQIVSDGKRVFWVADITAYLVGD